MTERILDVNDLRISFDTYSGEVQAIRGVDFHLNKGETLAIVGESGSGKSVTVRSIMKLLANNAMIKGGEINFEGSNILEKTDKEMQKIRGKDIAMIFQDPMTSLNPVIKIGKQIAEPIILHQDMSKSQAYERAAEILELVGIPNAKQRMNNYPHQFSGGQRQRIVIAIALACNPKILIADEPTTALDVTIQAQILELMKKLQDKIETSIIFITHDLGVVANVADRVAVMYAGEIVEEGSVDEIFYNPQHPYTWGLIGSMPTLDTEGELISIPGTPPDLLDPPQGDAFAIRSDYAMEIDFKEAPPMFAVTESHRAKTWLLHPDAPEVDPPAEIKRRYAIYQDLQAGKDVHSNQGFEEIISEDNSIMTGEDQENDSQSNDPYAENLAATGLDPDVRTSLGEEDLHE
ncbi:ABC transporter ATP-binding protein [Aerococcus kribbianus]|uniref:ABC transporter ATP-binding protein n=1 Tax=Aerococcus kribbianus TaxID=2999064 RepID=A0A9X3FNS3_9LACT|nr:MULTISPECIES: ABC transporter ATP-binding protein [unclassified Aerococcus]MCZ0716956.1 ABC transporter ATP-binding protein [Aerococcus sp. YH-aer221]MCZ0725244.1 ABC transporter ATP-binding protein [Aerococcus sp. YH-aer222]